MSIKTSFVELNGNGYDAATGQVISAFRPASTRNSQVIDGFVKSPAKLSKSAAQRAARSAELHRRAEKTRTLARSGLKKPAKYMAPRLQKLAPAHNPEREFRAKQIHKHGRVNRFGGAARSALSAAKTTPKSLSGEIINRRQSADATARGVPAPAPSLVTSVSHQKLERMLDEALVRADAHKAAMEYQAARHFWRRRWLSGPRRWVVLTVFLLALASSLFIAWQRIPQLSLKAASLRTHFNAVAPNYKPEGYNVTGPAQESAGAVSLTYQSGVDGSKYTISQSTSNMTSAMVAHSVVPQGADVQTSQVDGNTVYIYGANNNAAWVNNGVLYTIKDNANLSSDELLKIVNSINP